MATSEENSPHPSRTVSLQVRSGNSWDAIANSVQIKISPDLNEISILDDGIGISEEDIRERFLRLGGSSLTRGAVREGRRLIGHKGIGALSVIPICKEVRVLTTKENSSERVEAVLDIHRNDDQDSIRKRRDSVK